jgi:hypothetical protein
LAPALVGAGEEAREESRAKKLAASSTADWVEVACPPADARESDSGSRGLKGGTGELDPEGYAVMPSRHECSQSQEPASEERHFLGSEFLFNSRSPNFKGSKKYVL